MLTHSKCSQVVDSLNVKPQDHVWVYLLRLMFEVTNDIIECSMCVNFTRKRDTLFDLIVLLRDEFDVGLFILYGCAGDG